MTTEEAKLKREHIDMSHLPQAERNAIRQKAREHALARSKEGIEKLKEKYKTG